MRQIIMQTLDVLAGNGIRLVAMRCAGYDRVSLEAAERLGVKVARVPTYAPASVAEHALALMFALNRQVACIVAGSLVPYM